MKKKKTYQALVIFTASFMCCFLFQIKAQEIMNIQKKDKSVIAIPVSEIEMISFVIGGPLQKKVIPMHGLKISSITVGHSKKFHKQNILVALYDVLRITKEYWK